MRAHAYGILLVGVFASSLLPAGDPPNELSGPPFLADAPAGSGQQSGLVDVESRASQLLNDIQQLRTDAPGLANRTALPADVWPLTLGRDQTLHIARDAVAGRGSICLPADEPIYSDGGIVARPADLLNTTITINWPTIEAELLAAGEGPPPAPQAQPAVTLEQIEELEHQATALLEKLQQLKRALQAQSQPEARALTPDEAVEAWRQKPEEPVTVEFGVGEAGWPDAPIPIDEDPLPPIIADWDNQLSNGGTFSLFLSAAAIRGLYESESEPRPDRPAGYVDAGDVDQLSKRLKGKGVRVTGVLRAGRPDDRYTDYSIIVDDAANFRINE